MRIGFSSRACTRFLPMRNTYSCLSCSVFFFELVGAFQVLRDQNLALATVKERHLCRAGRTDILRTHDLGRALVKVSEAIA